MEDEKVITLETEDGEQIDLSVLEETRIGGVNYILAADVSEDEADGDGQCYILKDCSRAEDEEAVYEFVENDNELEYLFGIFAELVADMDLDLER